MIHRRLRPEFRTAFGTLYPEVDRIIMLRETGSALAEKSSKRTCPIPRSLRSELVITYGTFEAMFRIIVLDELQ